MRFPVGATALVVLAWAALAPARVAALDLETALADAARANPGLLARRAQVDAARHRVGPAGAWPNPMVELGVMDVPTSNRYGIDAMTMKTIGVSQKLPLAGARGLERRSARAAVESEKAGAEVAYWAVIAATWEAYADAYHAGERAAHAEAHAGLMDRLVQSSRARYASAQGRLEEMLRAEAERAHTLADAVTFRAEETAARARLDALRGLAPGSSREPLAPPPALAQPMAVVGILLSTDVMDGRGGIADHAHPRLRALDAEARRYRLAARASRRALWPEVELRYEYGNRIDKLTGGSLHGLPVPDAPLEDMYSASVGFELPVFMVQRELAEGAEMDAMSRGAIAQRREAELELASDLAGARAQATAAERTVALLADTVVATQRRALDSAMSAYASGTTDLWRALESAHALYDETLALTRARQDLARAQARMIAAAARGDLLGVRLPASGGSGR